MGSGKSDAQKSLEFIKLDETQLEACKIPIDTHKIFFINLSGLNMNFILFCTSYKSVNINRKKCNPCSIMWFRCLLKINWAFTKKVPLLRKKNKFTAKNSKNLHFMLNSSLLILHGQERKANSFLFTCFLLFHPLLVR